MSRFWTQGERPPEGVVGREVERARGDAVGQDGVDQVGHGELPVLARRRVVAGHRSDDLDHGRAVAAHEPEDAGRPATPERGGQRLLARVIVERRRRGDGHLGGRAARLLLARRHGLARGEAGGLGGLGGDARGLGLHRHPLEVEGQLAHGLPFAGQGRRRVAGFGVDAVDLEQPVPCGRLDLFGRPGTGAGRPEAGLGIVLGGAHGPRVGRGGGLLGPRLVLAIRALGGAQDVIGGGGAGPGARRDLAALVGQAAQIATRSGRSGRAGTSRVAPAEALPAAALSAAAPPADARPVDPASPAPASALARASGLGRSRTAVVGDVRMAARALAAALALSAVIIGSSPPRTGTPTRSSARRPLPATAALRARVIGAPGRTGVRRSGRATGAAWSPSRRSAGPPRAGSALVATKASSARVVARRGMASCATVTLTSRGAAGRARRTSIRAAPAATPSTNPMARNANSEAVTRLASLRSGSSRATGPSSGPA